MRAVMLALCLAALVSGCGLFEDPGASTEVHCLKKQRLAQDSNAGASVRCPDKTFIVEPPPA
jgi:hypothetical protein